MCKDLLETSGSSLTRALKFLVIVSAELEERQSKDEIDARPPPKRSTITPTGARRGERQAASDTIELVAIEKARNALKDCAARLAAAPWRAVVRERWPATIAHEIERLFDEMQGPLLPSGERLEPSADSVLLQLKDAFEVLIKFTATVLMCALIEAGGEDADWARRQLFKRGLSLGDWAGMLRQSVERCSKSDNAVPAAITTLARAAKKSFSGLPTISRLSATT